MRRLAGVVGIVSVAWLLNSGAVAARVDAASDVKVADTNVYAAIAARDAQRLDALLDDGFVLTNTFGEVYDKARFLAACCSGEPASKTLLLAAPEIDVRTFGNAAIVIARTEMRFMRADVEEKLSWRSMRVFIRSGGKWKLAAEQRTSIG